MWSAAVPTFLAFSQDSERDLLADTLSQETKALRPSTTFVATIKLLSNCLLLFLIVCQLCTWKRRIQGALVERPKNKATARKHPRRCEGRGKRFSDQVSGSVCAGKSKYSLSASGYQVAPRESGFAVEKKRLLKFGPLARGRRPCRGGCIGVSSSGLLLALFFFHRRL